MEGLWRIVTLCFALGISSFGVGVLPLSFTFSRTRMHQLSTFGNGLLLGAALGVIIPEGIEALPSNSGSPSTSKIAVSLLVGFALMLVIEQYLVPHPPQGLPAYNAREAHQIFPPIEEDVEFDMHMLDPEADVSRSQNKSRENNTSPGQRVIAYPLTLGLIIHSLADGLALGASAAGEDASDMSLSLVVFVALIIHKAPTALALTSSLLANSLSRSDIRKHIAFFSAATPIGALCSFGLLNFFGAQAGGLTGIALLISGGTFLYVATVIQPIGGHSHDHDVSLATEVLSKGERVSLLVLGIFLPFAVGSIIGHGHGHAHTH